MDGPNDQSYDIADRGGCKHKNITTRHLERPQARVSSNSSSAERDRDKATAPFVLSSAQEVPAEGNHARQKEKNAGRPGKKQPKPSQSHMAKQAIHQRKSAPQPTLWSLQIWRCVRTRISAPAFPATSPPNALKPERANKRTHCRDNLAGTTIPGADTGEPGQKPPKHDSAYHTRAHNALRRDATAHDKHSSSRAHLRTARDTSRWQRRSRTLRPRCSRGDSSCPPAEKKTGRQNHPSAETILAA